MKKRIALAFTGGLLLSASLVGTAGAGTIHRHLVDTPGKDDVMVGHGLCVAATTGGQHLTAFHNFHNNVHFGGLQSSGNLSVTTTGCP